MIGNMILLDAEVHIWNFRLSMLIVCFIHSILYVIVLFNFWFLSKERQSVWPKILMCIKIALLANVQKSN